jgi:hypothetical protein
MPHLVILYTPQLDRDTDMSVLCRKLADTMIAQRDESGKAVFPVGGTRVLAYPAAHFAVADGGAAARAQGKGDGRVEFVLGSGQAVKVVRDNDGREVTSEVATGLSTVNWEIPYEYLIAAKYCTDEAECKEWLDKSPGCYGHHSWTVTFKRKY